MRGVFRSRRSWVATVAAVAVAVPVYLVATALPAGAVDVGSAADLASNFNNASVTSITMTADITIDCVNLLDRTSGNDLTLDGAGHTLTQGCANSRVMTGAGTGALTLSDITITGGHTTFTDDGGGVLWNDDVTVTNAHVTGNTAGGNGGGIYTAGALVATGSTFTSNAADDSGGGAFAHGGVVVTNTVFTDNTAGTGEACACSGGGFYTGGTATVVGSTFTSNSAGDCGNCGAEGGGFRAGGDTSLTASTLTDNVAECSSSCGAQGGGAYVFDATFTIVDTTFRGNAASCDEACSGVGGGAFVAGNAEVSGSTFDDNDAHCGSECNGGKGGGLAVEGSTAGPRDVDAQAASNFLHVSRSAFTDNVATCGGCASGGGGIFADLVGTATIDHSTLSGNNTVGAGSAVLFDFGNDTATITNSTIVGNIAGSSGAVVSIGSDATLTLVYDTIVLNNLSQEVVPNGAGDQAAVDSANVHADGSLVSVATVIALAGGGVNCSTSEDGTQTSQGYNFADDLTCGFTNVATGDRQGAGLAPGLSPLDDNGGVGDTMPPESTSPLLNFIPPPACRTGAAAGVTDDERGVTRPQGPGCEIGAVELPFSIDPPAPKFTG